MTDSYRYADAADNQAVLSLLRHVMPTSLSTADGRARSVLGQQSLANLSFRTGRAIHR
jgi:hypothetical protein